jgi:hypothetical protein
MATIVTINRKLVEKNFSIKFGGNWLFTGFKKN